MSKAEPQSPVALEDAYLAMRRVSAFGADSFLAALRAEEARAITAMLSAPADSVQTAQGAAVMARGLLTRLENAEKIVEEYHARRLKNMNRNPPT